MIIQSYLAREILRPFLTIVGILGVVFLSYSTAVALNDAVAGLLPTETVLKFVLIKGLIALEVLLPVALYLSVVVGLGRLHADSEMTAMAAVGVGEARVFQVVLLLALVVALLVAALSLLVRPWAYYQGYLLEAVAETDFDIADLEPRQFYVGPDSRYSLFVEDMDSDRRTAYGIMFQTRSETRRQIVLADSMSQTQHQLDEPVTFEFTRGHAYQLGREGGSDFSVGFGHLILRLSGPDSEDLAAKSKARSTLSLRGSDNRKDLAEYQWRLSTPITTLLLAMLAVPLSRSAPRRGRHAKEIIAILAYAVFYNAMSMAKNLVQEGTVGAMPGLWWPLVLLALVTLVSSLWPWRRYLFGGTPRVARSGV